MMAARHWTRNSILAALAAFVARCHRLPRPSEWRRGYGLPETSIVQQVFGTRTACLAAWEAVTEERSRDAE